MIPSEREEAEHAIVPRSEKEQWLLPWTGEDERRLLLQLKNEGQELDRGEGPSGKKLKLKREAPSLAA